MKEKFIIQKEGRTRSNPLRRYDVIRRVTRGEWGHRANKEYWEVVGFKGREEYDYLLVPIYVDNVAFINKDFFRTLEIERRHLVDSYDGKDRTEELVGGKEIETIYGWLTLLGQMQPPNNVY